MAYEPQCEAAAGVVDTLTTAGVDPAAVAEVAVGVARAVAVIAAAWLANCWPWAATVPARLAT